MTTSPILFLFGTRPEAIKLAPLVLHLRRTAPALNVRVCVTAQHRDMLDSVLSVFQICPEHDLDVMRPKQTLHACSARILDSLAGVLATERPALVVVQGDTTTTFMGALAAFYSGVPVAHVEAGLRTGDLRRPFPEEANRALTSRLATLHFAPTERAAANLRADGVAGDAIFVTGNTGIDAALEIRARLRDGTLECPYARPLDAASRRILVTAHRRESFGEPLRALCRALRTLAVQPGVEIVFPVHPNPEVRATVLSELNAMDNVHLCEPLDYVSFVNLMEQSHFIVTDSGGVQEEAPSFGKPVLVTRDTTERPEAVDAGTARLVGCNAERIVEEARVLLNDSAEYARRARMHNPYGDGRASERIAQVMVDYYERHAEAAQAATA